MFLFTSLLGAQSTSPASQSLLELDGGIKILVDVGWDDGFDVDKLRELERHVPTLSFILLTHATIPHLAAFAHCCKNFPLFTRIPVYATTPVISLGRTLLQDLYSSNPLAASIIPNAQLYDSGYPLIPNASSQATSVLLQPPTSDEISSYFSSIHPLKYSQPHQPLPSPFSPPLNGLTITAYTAGHTVGGTFWHIQHGLESIVYAVDWNQARENVIPGAAWLGGAGGGGSEVIEQLRRPTALVCSSKGADRLLTVSGRRKRDEQLLDLVRRALRQGGRALIPCDSSARVLELAYLLEDAWAGIAADKDVVSASKPPGLYLASRTCGATMRYARSMLEWMDESVVKDFEATGGVTVAHNESRSKTQQGSTQSGARPDQGQQRTPFDFKHLRMLERKSQVRRALSRSSSAVFLASDSSLSWGFAQDIFRELANDSRNLVILPDQNSRGDATSTSVGHALWSYLDAYANKNSEKDGARLAAFVPGDPERGTTSIRCVEVAPLSGNELGLYQQYLARKQQLQDVYQADGVSTFENSADVIDDNSSSSSSSYESDMDRQGKALNVSSTLAHSRHRIGLTDAELGTTILIRQKGVHDFDVRGRKGREKLFPFVVKRKKEDEFGETIKPEDYLRAEEREESRNEGKAGNQRKESTVGQKRKWDDDATLPGAGPDKGTGNKKRRRTGHVSNGAGATGNGSTANGVDDSSSSEDSDEETEESMPEGPRKVNFSEKALQISLAIAAVDFSGLHDRRSLQMLIPLIHPRKLILVGGNESETSALALDCQTLLNSESQGSGESGTEIFTPGVGSVVDASVDTNAWLLKLSQSLFKQLKWHNVRGLGVVALTGRLEPGSEDEPAQESTRKKIKLADADALSAETGGTSRNIDDQKTDVNPPVLDVIPSSIAAATRSVAQPLHVGDLRLADLRKLMQSSGHLAEFRGEGTLLIDDIVAVRKSGTGRIEVEGGGLFGLGSRQMETTFQAVKGKIYEGLALVAGG